PRELLESGSQRFSKKNSQRPVSTFKDLTRLEKDLIEETLKNCMCKIEGPKGAAKQLGCAPSTLRDRMKRLKIKKP
ncbi:MAG: hypothetical protein KJT03_03015, partial [Verrucomicrobiae bacterium]|nr:hypothetical protein [Verrucomicrobiae bacterium]